MYKVTKFVYKHKVPFRRSAFTYCTEELPSRMDVGKHKYGGPYTTKQVEDVKAFWGIFKVVLSIGPAFLLQTVTQSVLPAFAKHGMVFLLNDNSTEQHEVHLEGVARYILISNGLLSPVLDLPTHSIPNAQANRTSNCCHGSFTLLYLGHGSRGTFEEHRQDQGV